MPPQSDLPIVGNTSPEPFEQRTEVQKYGTLYYLGIAGLVALIAMVVWFGASVWSLRSIWKEIYIVHDRQKTETERIEAAFRLSQDSRLTSRQAWDIAMRRDVPDLARYLLAESIGTDLVAADPKAYALAVAHSKGWPGWLRLLTLRPLAIGAGRGFAIPPEALDDLRSDSQGATSLWASYARAALARSQGNRHRASEAELRGALDDEDDGPLARLLWTALNEPDGSRRDESLREATLWLRDNDPDAVRVWRGWTVRDTRLMRTRG